MRDEKKKRKLRKNKPYQPAAYPGQKVQMDVKIVPRLLRSKRREILPVHSKGRMHTLGIPENVHGAQLRQRQRLSETACQSGAVSDSDVPDRQRCGFPNALPVIKSRHKTLFEEALIEMGIAYHRIRISTPRHNGKVERPHGPMNSASTNTYACTAWQTAAGRWCSTRERQTITS